jgi:hypothetical protein
LPISVGIEFLRDRLAQSIDVILVEEHSIPYAEREQQEEGIEVIWPIFCQIEFAIAQSWDKV